MMKALIYKGIVVQIEAEEFPVAPALEWVDITGITPAPEVGWSYDGLTFSTPPRPPLDEQKAEKRKEFKAEALVRITAQVPDWDSFEWVGHLASVWIMFGASPNAAQTLARDIYLYTKNTALLRVTIAADETVLDAIDPTAADPFGDGTAWPT